MTTHAALLALVLLAAATPVAAAQVPDLVAVTLVVDATRYPLLPEAKTCDVLAPEGADGKLILAAATAQGCIAGFTGSYFVGLGFYLDGVDGRRAVCDTPVWLVHCTYWAVTENGDGSTGIDGWSAAEGNVYALTYDRSFAGLPIP